MSGFVSSAQSCVPEQLNIQSKSDPQQSWDNNMFETPIRKRESSDISVTRKEISCETPIDESPVYETHISETQIAETPIVETYLSETPISCETPISSKPATFSETQINRTGDSIEPSGIVSVMERFSVYLDEMVEKQKVDESFRGKVIQSMKTQNDQLNSLNQELDAVKKENCVLKRMMSDFKVQDQSTFALHQNENIHLSPTSTDQHFALAGTNSNHLPTGTNTHHLPPGTNTHHFSSGTNTHHFSTGTNTHHLPTGTNPYRSPSVRSAPALSPQLERRVSNAAGAYSKYLRNLRRNILSPKRPLARAFLPSTPTHAPQATRAQAWPDRRSTTQNQTQFNNVECTNQNRISFSNTRSTTHNRIQFNNVEPTTQ
eukprot:405465_1